MSRYPFRTSAKESLSRAKVELAANAPHRLKFAALELRMAMEALTYDRVQAYRREIPEKDLKTWQPRKVLRLLLDVDPSADSDSTLTMNEDGCSEPAKLLGTERVLSLRTLKKNYDALGWFLHMPTLEQVEKRGGVDYDKLRIKCQEISQAVADALASPIFNITLGSFATIDCERCGKPIRKRIPSSTPIIKAPCLECDAPYVLERQGTEILWRADQEELDCRSEGCTQKIVIWRDEIRLGGHWTCSGCKISYEFALGIRPKTSIQ